MRAAGASAPAAPRAAMLADERGSVAILTGVVLALMTVIGIVVVDLGSVYLKERKAQGILDIAAQLAAQDIENAESVVRAVLAQNGIADIDELSIALGQYTADSSLSPAARFLPDAAPPNALRVRMVRRAELFFARPIFPSGSIEFAVTSVGAQSRKAAISIGSRLLSVQDGVLNALLGSLLGGSVGLSAVDYNNLADAQVDLFGFLDALAVETGVTAGTYDQLLDAEVGLGSLVAAIEAALGPDQSSYAISAMATLAEAAQAGSATVPLSQVIDLGPVGDAAIGSAEADAFAVEASVLSLLSATATAANGDTQLTLDTGVNIPGLLSATVDVEIGERPQSSPWLSIGDSDVVVRTAQVRAGIRASIGGSGALAGLAIDIPLVVSVAPAEARLTSIVCDAKRQPTVTVMARPGVVEAWIGETIPFKLESFSEPGKVRPATLVNVLSLAKVTAQAHVEMANVSPTELVFDTDDIREHRARTVSTKDLTTSVTASLLRDLQLGVKVGPLSLVPKSLIATQVLGALQAVTSVLDDAVASVLQPLGVNLGEADVWVDGAHCGRSGLVG